MRCREVLQYVGHDSLAAARVVGTNNVVNTISQVTSFAAACGLVFCTVSTNKVTWLMYFDDDYVLRISRGLPHDNKSPTVLQVSVAWPCHPTWLLLHR